MKDRLQAQIPADAAGRADEYALSRLRVAASPLFLRAEEVRRGVALLMLGQSHLLHTLDPLLKQHGIGRAHARLLGHVVRWPGLTMSDLVELDGTSKQALSRVAKDLGARALIGAQPNLRDRRRREWRASAAGEALAAEIERSLSAAMTEAYGAAGRDAVSGFWQVLEGLIPVAARLRMTRLERGGR